MFQRNLKLGKSAISYAADSRDYRNLWALLSHNNRILNVDYIYNGETVLNTLVKILENKECAEVEKYILRLLRVGASPNDRDEQGLTPLENLLKNENVSIQARCRLVTVFLEEQSLSYPLYLRGLNFLLQNAIYNDPPYHLLVRDFENMTQETLHATLRHYETFFKNWSRQTMQIYLWMAHMEDPKNKRNALAACIAMIQPSDTPEQYKEYFDSAIREESWCTVFSLLEVEHIRSLPWKYLLRSTIGRVQRQSQSEEYEECLLALLRPQGSLVIAMDEDNNTPLHYAVQCDNQIAIRVLLRLGAPLGMCNRKGRIPFEYMQKSLLKERVAHCMRVIGQDSSHESYEIVVDFISLTDQQPDRSFAKPKQRSPLLLHPLIACFVHIQWPRLINILYINFGIFLLFTIAQIAHISLLYPQRVDHGCVILTAMAMCLAYIPYMLVVIVLKYLFPKYLSYKLDLSLILMIALTCLEVAGNESTKRVIAIVAILLMALKIFSLLRTLSLSLITTHMLILRKVTISFLKSFAYPLISALALYVVYAARSFPDQSDMYEVKTITVLHDVRETDWSCIILTVFMFMAMLLTNLLNALAIFDTQLMLIYNIIYTAYQNYATP